MKKADEKNRCGNLISLFVATLLFGVFNMNAQNPISFESNISLSDVSELGNSDYASGALEIITANEKVYVYTGDKLLVMSDDGQSVAKIIPFDQKYGKYNPQAYNQELDGSDISFMTVFINESSGANGREDMYVVTPNLDILLIDTYNDVITHTFDDVSVDIPDLKPLHGRCIIKFDNVKKRIYWLINGRQADTNQMYLQNCTGNFHFREVYFAIYTNVPTNGIFNTTPHYVFHKKTTGDYDDYLDKNIVDFEFNSSGTNDYFYLAKLNRVETWNFNDLPSGPLRKYEVDSYIYGFDLQGKPRYYKFSKLLLIDEIDKIVALPYRYPFYSASMLQANKVPLIYIIDCFNTTADAETIDSPNQRVFDTVFLPGRSDLAICCSADLEDQLENCDLAFYRFDPTNTGDWLDQINILSTSTNPIAGKDINSPTNFTLVNNAVLASKKDEIISLSFDTQDNIYEKTDGFNSNEPYEYENNFFRKGTVRKIEMLNDYKCFILNTGGGKIESFNFTPGGTNITHSGFLRAYYPVYHIVSNTLGTKQYLFNKLDIENTGFFIYNQQQTTVNINDDLNDQGQLNTQNDFLSIIGDCIYNKFTGEFLVTKNENFGENPATTLCIYADDEYNSLIEEFEIENVSNGLKFQNAKEMFIDPNGILYILVNTLVGDKTDPNKPYIVLYDATNQNYDFINSFHLTDFTANDVVNNSEYYMAHFCFSASNNTTFITVTPQHISLPPYNSEFNTMYCSWTESGTPNEGYLYSCKDEQLQLEFESSITNPGRIVCPDDGDDSHQSVYEGKLYILTDEIFSYNYTDQNNMFDNKKLNEIVYSPYHDKLFGLADEGEDAECVFDRTSNVYEITFDNGFNFTKIHSEPGQSAGFFLNPYDNKLYLHTKFDNEKLGVTPAQIIQIDVPLESGQVMVTTKVLRNADNGQNRSNYPELDHNPFFNYFNYNLTTPYINPYQNKIYLPNGWHSNVSVVDFVPNETLLLNNKPGTLTGSNGNNEGSWSWLSFPRLNSENPIVNDVLYGPPDRIDPMGYLTASELQNIVIGEPQLLKNKFDGTVWPQTNQGFHNIDSRFGYKLFLHYEDTHPEQITLLLTGNLIYPGDAIIDLAGEGKENWVGYYLQETQSPFDAIDDAIEENLSVIKTQNWVCFNENPASEGPQWSCASNKGEIELKYGDMAIIKTKDYMPDPSFQWQSMGFNSCGFDRPETLYYGFTETSDYTPLFIELDTTENPVEIGAFIGDSCVGGTTVTSDDTLVLISAYTEGLSGDIYFEEYTDNKQTAVKVRDYWVKDNIAETIEKRMINSRERKDYYVVSFKPEENTEQTNNEVVFSIFPNPVDGILNINYEVLNTSNVDISVLDSYGRHVATILSTSKNAGVYSLQWDIRENKLPKGIYVITLKLNSGVYSRKVVIN